MPFAFDTSKAAPGPYRMPFENELRCRVYFKHPFRDCTTVCECSPDLEEATDATIRLLSGAPDMLQALKDIRERAEQCQHFGLCSMADSTIKAVDKSDTWALPDEFIWET